MQMPFPTNRVEARLVLTWMVGFYLTPLSLVYNWFAPAALLGLVALAAGIAMHIRVKRRAGFDGVRPKYFLVWLSTRSTWIALQILRGKIPPLT